MTTLADLFEWLLTRIQCVFKGHSFRWIRNLHGDEVNYRGGRRSEWICRRCGKIHYKNDLHKEIK